MDYIVFDLESQFERKNQFPYILEIGAVRIRKVKNEMRIVDKFQTYVRPPNYTHMKDEVLKFIGANERDFKEAPNMFIAIQKFRKWIWESKEYLLVTWSTSDLWILAKNRTKMKIELGWVKNFNDIQPFISQKLAGRDHMSLENAILQSSVKRKQIVFHSAIFDAYNTAYLLMEYFEELKGTLQKNNSPFSIIASQIQKTCIQCNTVKHYTEFKILKGKKFNSCIKCQKAAYRKKVKSREDDSLIV